MADRHAVVVGAGVIGLCVARSLLTRGWRVTVVERGEAGEGASRSNAGWIVPDWGGPVPGPGLVGATLRSLREPAAPFALRPSRRLDDLRWLLDFWRHANAADHAAGRTATVALGAPTRALFDRLRAEGVTFEGGETDILYAYLSQAQLERDLAERAAGEKARVVPTAAAGATATVSMSGVELREREPALRDEVVGGYRVTGQRWVRPESLVAGLLADILARGAEVRTRTTVTGFDRSGGGVRAVRTDDGAILCDEAILCAGVATTVLARMLGVRLPMLAGVGYSLDYAPAPRPITSTLYLDEARLAVTPYGGSLRVAGLMDLASPEAPIQRDRPGQIAMATARYLRDWPADPDRASAPWAGMRPLTPDGLPAIGRLPGLGNVTVATGHAMLGITLAPATAESLADMLDGDGDSSRDVLVPFDPARFGRRVPPHRRARTGHP